MKFLFSAAICFLLFLPFNSYSQFRATEYNTSNSPIPGNTVYDCASYPLDSAFNTIHELWIATDNGLTATDFINYWTTYTTADGLPENSVRCILMTPDTTLWGGTFTGGLFKFKNGTFTVYNTVNSILPDNFVKALAFEPPSTLWIGTPSGLSRFKNDTITNYDLSGFGINSTHVSAIQVRKDGVKIIGMVNGGFAYYNDTIFDFYTHVNSGLPDNTILDMSLDSLDNPYMVLPSGGIVAHFGGSTFQLYNQGTFPNMPTNSFKSIARIPDGFFAGSIDKGLFIKDQNNPFNNGITWLYSPAPEDTNMISIYVSPFSFKYNYTHAYVGTQNKGLVRVQSETAGINSVVKDNTISAAIVNGELYITSKNNLEEIYLYTLDGRMINVKNLTGTTASIPLENISSGLLIAHCVTTKGVAVKKLFIE